MLWHNQSFIVECQINFESHYFDTGEGLWGILAGKLCVHLQIDIDKFGTFAQLEKWRLLTDPDMGDFRSEHPVSHRDIEPF